MNCLCDLKHRVRAGEGDPRIAGDLCKSRITARA